MPGELIPFTPNSRGHDLQVLALESRIIDAAGGEWFRAIDELRYLAAFAAPDIIARVLALVAPRLDDAVLNGVRDALTLGASFALGLAVDTGAAKTLTLGGIETRIVPVPIRRATGGLTAGAELALANSRALALNGGVDAVTVIAPLVAHRNYAERIIRTNVNAAANAGVSRTAKKLEVPLVWVAERDACLHCLGLQGAVVKVGKSFDYRRTYAEKPLAAPPGGLRYPPRHPNCRCTVEPLFSRDYADALGREADRSVLRGFSLPNESNAARVAAAARLLDEGVVAPKTVKDYAESAVKRGSYRRRDVPTG